VNFFMNVGDIVQVCMEHFYTQDYWTFPSSSILETRKLYVSETGSVSVLR
jgi:hypothetical protein